MWALTGAFAPIFVRACTLHLPLMDEWLLVEPALDGWDFGWLSAPHYGHRIPIPKLALVSLYELGGLVAIRLASGLAPWLASAALIVASRRARGRAHVSDAVLPLLLAGPPLAFSALHGFDLHFGLDVLFTSLALLALVTHARRPSGARLMLAVLLLGLAIGEGVDGAIAASGLACALPFVDRRRARGIGLACALGALALASIPSAELHARTSPLAAQLGTFADLLAMPFTPMGALHGRLLALAFGLVVALALASTRRLPRRHRPAAWVAGLSTLGAVAVLGAIAHVYAEAEPTPPRRYASLVARAFAFAHIFLSTLSRGRGARLPRLAPRRLAPTAGVALLAACLVAAPAHLSKSHELCAWVTRLDRDTAIAIRSGWTPEEITEQFGDELHPHDPELVRRALGRWLATR